MAKKVEGGYRCPKCEGVMPRAAFYETKVKGKAATIPSPWCIRCTKTKARQRFMRQREAERLLEPQTCAPCGEKPKARRTWDLFPRVYFCSRCLAILRPVHDKFLELAPLWEAAVAGQLPPDDPAIDVLRRATGDQRPITVPEFLMQEIANLKYHVLAQAEGWTTYRCPPDMHEDDCLPHLTRLQRMLAWVLANPPGNDEVPLAVVEWRRKQWLAQLTIMPEVAEPVWLDAYPRST